MDGSGSVVFDNIKEKDVPVIIRQQFDGLDCLRKKVQTASERAESAKNSAKTASEQSAGIFNRKEAIESIQDAEVDLAEAQVLLAEAQQASLEYQRKLGEVTKFLFGMGVTSIAMNRAVVEQLQEKLEMASKTELDDLTREKIREVISDLKKQEDIMLQQQRTYAAVKDNQMNISTQANTTEQLGYQVAALGKQNNAIAQMVFENESNDAERDKQIASNNRHDEEQDDEIESQAQKDAELEAEAKRQAQKDAELEAEVKRQIQKHQEHDTRLVDIEEKMNSQDRLIQELTEKVNLMETQKTDKTITLISYIIGFVGVILSVLHFFI